MANKKIIELDAASQVNSDAVFPLSQLVSGDQKTLKATVAQMQAAMLAPVSDLVTLGESSGSIASFSTDIADKLFSCYVNVTAQQAGSGTPSPDNVRAISGWSECNLVQGGTNLWDGYWEVGGISETTGGNTSNNNYDRTNFLRCNPQMQIYGKSYNSNQLVFYYYDENKTYLDFAVATNTTVTTPANCKFFRSRISNDGQATSLTSLLVSLNVPASTTAYQAFGTTHNIPFNQTIYGGVLDVLSGVLTVTHGYLDLGTKDYTYNSTGAFFANFYAPRKAYTRLISDIYEYIGYKSDADMLSVENYKIADNAGQWLKIKNTNYTDPTAFKTAMSGHYIIYELDTPTVIQLTPTEVKTILGQNNIFGDCGDIDLKYLETIGNRL